MDNDVKGLYVTKWFVSSKICEWGDLSRNTDGAKDPDSTEKCWSTNNVVKNYLLFKLTVVYLDVLIRFKI